MQPLGVPAEVLAELDHRLAAVALQPEREPRVLQRHLEALRRPSGAAGRGSPARSARASRNSHGLPKAPRPTITPAQPVWLHHAHHVFRGLDVAIADDRDVQRLDHPGDLVPVGLAGEHLGAGARVQREGPGAGILHPERDADRIPQLVVPAAPGLHRDGQVRGRDAGADDLRRPGPRSRRQPEPPFRCTTFLTGQPKLMSMNSGW